jgi:predicted RNA-binding protein with PIN domain
MPTAPTLPPSASAPDPDAALPSEISLWLVDGYNVLHTVLLGGEDREDFWKSERRDALRARIEGLPDLDVVKRRVVIVFDGGRPSEAVTPTPVVAVRFEPCADDWIVQQARRASRPDQIGVVTSDRQVAGRCQHAGARVVAPKQFVAWCAGPG